jgi:hypothetical protein
VEAKRKQGMKSEDLKEFLMFLALSGQKWKEREEKKKT